MYSKTVGYVHTLVPFYIFGIWFMRLISFRKKGLLYMMVSVGGGGEW